MTENPPGRREQERMREQVILQAAIAELALSDYGGLTIEKVAARAGVNKTTVYRKWDTKAELVRAAIVSVSDTYRFGPSAGDLRADLLGIARDVRDFSRSFEGRSLMRLGLISQELPELAEMSDQLNERRVADMKLLLSAAVQRGEVSADVDILMLVDMLWGAIHVRVATRSGKVDDTTLERMVELLMRAVAVAEPKLQKKRRPSPRKAVKRRR